MMVRQKKSAPAQKGQTPKPRANPYTFPAPIRGWVLNENIATAQQAGARILDNWFPTTTGIRVRGGKTKYATLGGPVLSMFSYESGATEKLFAASSTAIYDITSVADPLVVPTPSLGSMTAGYYSFVQFGTAAGDFLVIANGADSVRNYNGSSWSTPSITGVTSANLSHVWSFGNRLFFVEEGTLSAWYLPVDSIAGAATEFPMAGVFSKGGSLLFGAKWSMDAGDGLDDKCVFVSTEGEVAVYEGTDPSSATTWRRAGLYELPRPLGRRPYVQAGGDLLIATEVGAVPVSAAISRDIGALDGSAVSRPISPYWQKRAAALAGQNWEMLKIPRANMMVVSQPDDENPSCLVANLQTGAWARFTGWDTQCLGIFNGQGYFGSADNCVYQMESGGSDDGATYTCTFLGQFEGMGGMMQKTITQMRPVFRVATPFTPQMSALTNYQEELSAPPSSVANFTTSLWDGAIWDSALWDAGAAFSVEANWYAIGKTGFSVAPELQITFGVTPPPVVELVTIDAEYLPGAMVA